MEDEIAFARSSLLNALAEAQGSLTRRRAAVARTATADNVAELRRLTSGVSEAKEALVTVPWGPFDIESNPKLAHLDFMHQFFVDAAEASSKMDTLRRELTKPHLRAEDLHEASRVIVTLLCTLLPDSEAQVVSQKMLSEVFRTKPTIKTPRGENSPTQHSPTPPGGDSQHTTPRVPTLPPPLLLVDRILTEEALFGFSTVEAPLCIDGRHCIASNVGSARPQLFTLRSPGISDKLLDVSGAEVSYAIPVAGQAAGRPRKILLSLPAGASMIEAPNDREAVFWFVLLRHLTTRHMPYAATGLVSLSAPPGPASAEKAPAAVPGLFGKVRSEYLLRHYEHLNNCMSRLLADISDVQAELRQVSEDGDLLLERYNTLCRRKRTMYHERSTLSDALRKMELQLCSTRGGGKDVAPLICSAGSFLSAKAGLYKDTPLWSNTMAELTRRPQPPEPLKVEEPKGAVAHWITSPEYHKLPFMKVAPQPISAPVIASLSGAEPDECPHQRSFGNDFCARIITNYPRTEEYLRMARQGKVPPEIGSHCGDPICDHYVARIIGNRVVMALCDGCSWGRLPLEAATRASHAFVECVSRNQHKIFSTEDTGDILLLGASFADTVILHDKEDPVMAGTTTLVGGILLELAKDEPGPGRYAFACLTVGDCKAFHYSRRLQTIEDITEANRLSMTNPCDPGGRLGPHLSTGADLRNLELRLKWCDEGDVIFLVTDGVHDNFDPVQQGDTPRDWNLHADTWDEAAQKYPEKTSQVKAAFMVNKIKEVLGVGAGSSQELLPETVVARLLEWCTNLTRPSREWIENNPKKKMVVDTKAFPGKLDHASVVCLRVGTYWKKP